MAVMEKPYMKNIKIQLNKDYRIKHLDCGDYRLSGQITVFAALVFGLMVSLLTVMLEAAICQGARTRMAGITNVSVQSVFSQFSRPLVDEYEIFAGVVYEEDEVKALLDGYVYDNCDNGSELSNLLLFEPYGIKLAESQIEELKLLTDDDGIYFYDEAVEYMKLGQFSDDISSILEDFTKLSDSEGVKEVGDELTRRQKEACEIDALILKLLMQTEGVKTGKSGFSQFLGKLSSASSFVKKICVNGTDFGNTGLDNRLVYDAVSSEYYDISSKLSALKGELDWIKYVYNYPLTRGSFVDEGYRYNAGLICGVVNNVSKKIDEALETIEQIESKSSILANNLEGSKTILSQNRDKMSDELSQSYAEEFDELSKYKTGEANSLCDVALVKEQLLACKASIGEISTAVNALAGCEMDITTIDGVYEQIDGCIAICSKYPGASISFNYENVTLGKGKDISALEKIGKVFSEGFMSLVIEDTSKISGYVVSQSDLSSMYCSYSNASFDTDSDGVDAVYEDYLYNKYISTYCSSYTDSDTDKTDGIKYEMEYVLSGKSSDKENLQAAINKLLAARYVFDLSYIMCDTIKKQECLDMAVLLLGFTGVYGVIKTGQYMLLSAWAYAEAVSDVKILLEKGKVPLKKSSDNWKTSLESIIEGRIFEGSDNTSQGMDYETYLQLLYFLEKKSDKSFYTMDVLEQNMIEKGYNHIRMYHYMYSLKGTISYKYRGGRYSYNQNFEFRY
jgi:hypothetical protein